MTTRTIQLREAGHVGWLTFYRPDRRNGMTPQMIDETHAALTRWRTREDLSVVVITGDGDWFCPGADIDAVVNREPGSRLEDLPAHAETTFQVPALLHDQPQLTVAAINGGCAGAGLGFAAACDLRFAKQTARFNTAFLGLGIAGDMCLPWTLPRLIGPARARRLSFLPGPISADEARAIGLVDEVFAASEYDAAIRRLIEQLDRYSPEAVRKLKAHYLTAENSSLAEFSRIETRHHLASFDPSCFTDRRH
ncbi:enoyl-CoA hydratase/isomerase family protein [Mycolicibacterium palauense]|uniref:enoyl-CoA hydratase/isomerase family protein n=1 Tax=Mycolicibacterium palauense TaxID=2034511 RepID=UPI000BFF0340|nr:enoyl-CoA hydratase/isomerase family protein [Mycolicibacterium palauense]